MKVQELIEKYEKNNRIDIANEIEVKPYISITQKKQLADAVLDECIYEVDNEIHVNSVDKYLLFIISVISLHTNLEFDYENGSSVEDYDALCESGLLIKVIDTFKDDYASCQEVLNMVTSDRLQDSMTIEKKIYKFIDSIQNILEGAVNKFTEELDFSVLNNLPIDKEKLSNLYNLLEKK